MSTAALEVASYEGTTGDRTHVTRNERGLVPVAALAGLAGAAGEFPGEHRNRHGQRWEEFKTFVREAGGGLPPVFVTVDYGMEPVLSEGNHRRDAALELGLEFIPAEVRYFGHAEHEGTLAERYERQAEAG
jgi:hypothetical protein